MIQTAGIFAVGDEVLNGETINTNAAWLARELNALGIQLRYHVTIGDNLLALSSALEHYLSHSDLILVVGGLGPTHDDITKEAVAAVVQQPLEWNEAVAERIRARHRPTPGHEGFIYRQSTVIRGADILPNSRGTAPGQRVDFREKILVLLPGPPREMQAVFTEHIRPWLERESHSAIRRDTWITYQWGESTVAHFLSEMVLGQHPKVGLYASPGVVEIRMESRADLPSGQSLANVRAGAWIDEHIPGVLYRRTGDQSRAERLVCELIQRHWHIAVMESLTGGMLTSALVDVAGASQCLSSGIVAYTNDAKTAMGVPGFIIDQRGAVSADTAREMAQAIRQHYGAEIGLATTGFAGPDGGTALYPVGTYFVAVATPDRTMVRRRQLRSDRIGVRRAATEAALTILWEAMDLPHEF